MAAPGRLERLSLYSWLCALALGAWLDAFLILHGLIKLETGNVAQLRYHALIRDGIVVIAAPAGSYCDALHNWFFHALFLISPRLDFVAASLNLVYYAAVVGLYFGVRRRLGTTAAAVSSGLLLASPVSAVLSKHVIATSLVPAVGVFYALGHLDFARTGDRSALGRCVGALAALVALNHGHILILPALLYEMRRRGVWRPPAWSFAVAGLALSSGAVGIWAWGTWSLWGGHYASPLQFLRRAVLVEWRMNDMLPGLDLLFVLAAWAGCVFWFRRDRAPRGLAGLLAYGLPMVLLNREATVFWQIPFCLLVGWAAAQELGLALVALLYVPLTLGSYQWLFRRHAEEPNFFVLSSLRTRERVLGVLKGEMGLHAGDLDRLELHTQQTDGGIPALAPGLAYLAGRLEPPLPPGGDRCFAVSDQDIAPPPGAASDEKVERYGLWFASWRGGPPCPGNARRPLAPVLGFDLRQERVRLVSFDR